MAYQLPSFPFRARYEKVTVWIFSTPFIWDKILQHSFCEKVFAMSFSGIEVTNAVFKKVVVRDELQLS